MNHIREAERAIVAILRELEIKTSGIVRGLSITEIETTSLDDPRRQMRKRVVIDIEPQPGVAWD